MTTLCMIRHGQASFGQSNYDVLSELGHEQARITGRHLSRLDERFDVLISGELSRQIATAESASEALEDPPELVHDAAFNEYDADGLFRAYLPQVLAEDKELAAQRTRVFEERKLFQRAFAQMTEKWIAGEPHDLGDFEPWEAFEQRVRDGLTRLRGEYGRDARIGLFTSGGVIAVAVGTALDLPPPEIVQVNWTVYNTSVSDFRSSRHSWRMMGFNNITHLRLENDPALITHR